MEPSSGGWGQAQGRGCARAVAAAAVALSAFAAPAAGAAQDEWLSLCGQCLSPGVVSKTNLGTATASATARIRQRDAEDWCARQSPGEKGCVREQMASEDAKKLFRASADCTKGRLDAIDGRRYLQAGVWKNDVGRGRTRWRDPDGHVVGQDNASNGLALSQQWETLCPGQRAGVAELPAPPAASPAHTAPNAARFAPGERIEAKYGGRWVRGSVQQIRASNGAQGPDLAYDVLLDNGRRGVLPASMLRKSAGG